MILNNKVTTVENFQNISNNYIENSSTLTNIATSNSNFLTFDGILFYSSVTDLVNRVYKQASNGTVLSKIIIPSGILGSIEIFNKTTVIANLFGGNDIILWNHVSNTTNSLPIISHHDIIYNHLKNTYLTLQYEEIANVTTSLLFDTIVEFDSTGQKLWEFNFSSVINSISDEYRLDNRIDVTHANSLQWNFQEGKIHVNLRNLDQIYQIDYASKEVDWILGKNGDFDLFNKDNQMVQTLFHQPHDLHIIDNNHILLFDNRYNLPNFSNELRSRIIKISFDLGDLTAKITQEWIAPVSLYSPIWGSVEKLPNNNFLAAFGFNSFPSIVEINMTSQEYSEFPINGRFYNIAFYQNGPNLNFEESYYILSGVNKQLNFTGYASYNWNFNEEFDLHVYLNGTLISSNSQSLHSLWQKTDFTINFSQLGNANYNLTVIVESIFNTKSIFFITLIVKDYFLSHSEIINYEFGKDLVLDFSGLFKSPVFFNLKLESQTLLNISWDGTAVILDQSIAPGNYILDYEVFNTTMSIVTGDLVLILEPQLAPNFTITSPLIFEWGDPIEIVVNVTEASGFQVELEFDGLTWIDVSYEKSEDQITLVLPQLSETVHEFDLILTDDFSLSSSQLIEVTIISPQIPIIVSRLPISLDWGKTETMVWEIHGGNSVQFYRNGTLLQNSTLTSLQFTHTINWRVDDWQLNVYNLTLVVSNSNNQTSFSQLIGVDVLQNDPYGSSIVISQTSWSLNPEFALGEPDGSSAEIQFGYENGRILIDMNSKVINTTNTDLTVYATGGTYRVLVSENQAGPFIDLGTAQGVNSFELVTIDQFQFVIIEYITGSPILLDAIEGHQIAENDYNQEYSLDLTPIELSIDTTQYMIIWNVSDHLGLNYSVYVNSEIAQRSFWDGQAIVFDLHIQAESDSYNVTIVTYDILGNNKTGEVQISIESDNFPLIFVLGLSLVLLLVLVTWRRFSKK